MPRRKEGVCILNNLCSWDYLKCFTGKEQQWWDHNVLLFRLSGEDVLSGRACSKAVIHKPSSRGACQAHQLPTRVSHACSGSPDLAAEVSETCVDLQVNELIPL